MKKLKIILPVLTVLMLAVIWGHSLMPADMSADESGFIYDLFVRLFGSETVTDHFIRKTAHFTEYMIFGILCASDMIVYGKRGIAVTAATLYMCLFAAVFDETIQIYSDGRAGMLFDVWLDHIGSITGITAAKIIDRIRRK